jgi:hypothetical protein
MEKRNKKEMRMDLSTKQEETSELVDKESRHKEKYVKRVRNTSAEKGPFTGVL